jgi:hypothetical protein
VGSLGDGGGEIETKKNPGGKILPGFFVFSDRALLRGGGGVLR